MQKKHKNSGYADIQMALAIALVETTNLTYVKGEKKYKFNWFSLDTYSSVFGDQGYKNLVKRKFSSPINTGMALALSWFTVSMQYFLRI